MSKPTSTGINAFGKIVTREEAYQIILYDMVAEIAFARCCTGLKEVLMYGWKPLPTWSDQELEDFIGNLSVENQPHVVEGVDYDG